MIKLEPVKNSTKQKDACKASKCHWAKGMNHEHMMLTLRLVWESLARGKSSRWGCYLYPRYRDWPKVGKSMVHSKIWWARQLRTDSHGSFLVPVINIQMKDSDIKHSEAVLRSYWQSAKKYIRLEHRFRDSESSDYLNLFGSQAVLDPANHGEHARCLGYPNHCRPRSKITGWWCMTVDFIPYEKTGYQQANAPYSSYGPPF